MTSRKYATAGLAILCAAGLAATVPSCSEALATSLSGNTWHRAGGVYDESTGLFQNTARDIIGVFDNAQAVGWPGKTFTDTFDYGDNLGFGCIQSDWTVCSGTDTEVNIVDFADGYQLGVGIIGTQSILPGINMDAASLDISGDQTANDGVELFGGNLYGMRGKPFIAGSDPAFGMCATLTLADASGTDDLAIGWRENEVFQKAVDSYTDRASIGIVTNANPAAIQLETQVGGAGATTTDTTDTWADGATKKLCVLVSAARVVTYTINGVAPSTTAAFTFSASLPVIPFVSMLQHGDFTEEADLTLLEVFYQ